MYVFFLLLMSNYGVLYLKLNKLQLNDRLIRYLFFDKKYLKYN